MTIGKKFERVIYDAIKPHAYVLRLMDPPAGYLGAANPCDFIVFTGEHMVMMELKVVGKGKSLPRTRLSDTQLEGMLEATRHGVIAGVLVWFKGSDVTLWYEINHANDIFKTRKSLPITEPSAILHGVRKRVWFTYDMKRFLGEICTTKYKENCISDTE